MGYNFFTFMVKYFKILLLLIIALGTIRILKNIVWKGLYKNISVIFGLA